MIQNKQKLLLSNNFNLLVEKSSGEYFCWIGAHDIYDKFYVEKLLKKMSIKDITSKISKENNISKKIVYDYCLKKKNEI